MEMNFAESLQEKLGKHNQEEIQELILDKIFTTEKLTVEQKEVLEKYTNLIHITLNEIGLTSLENFPLLKQVQILELNKNKLNGEDLGILVSQCPLLYKLKIEDNEIDSVDKLKCLAQLGIKKFNLEGNPFLKKEENYKEELFKIFPKLESVDDTDKEGKDVESTIYGEEDDEEFNEEEEEEEEEEEPGDEEDEGEDGDEGGDDEDEEENEEEGDLDEEGGDEEENEEEDENQEKGKKRKK